MTVSSFSTLIAAVGNEWLARDQDTILIARIPDFITLFEAKANRDLVTRQNEVRSITTIDITTNEPEFIALPADYQAIRRVRLESLAEKPRLDFLTPEQMDDFRANIGNAVARPRFYTIIGTEMELGPTPDANYELEMVYQAAIPPLTASNTTNWLLSLAPDLYLYGVLLESAAYIKEDDRLPIWTDLYKKALDGLNALGSRARAS